MSGELSPGELLTTAVLPPFLRLLQDPVASVRLKAARHMGTLKARLRLPNDAPALAQMEAALAAALALHQPPRAVAALTQSARDLSAVEPHWATTTASFVCPATPLSQATADAASDSEDETASTASDADTVVDATSPVLSPRKAHHLFPSCVMTDERRCDRHETGR